jgi:hypothetical protein
VYTPPTSLLTAQGFDWIDLVPFVPDSSDVTPPITSITSGPDGTTETSNTATFEFSSNEAFSSFTCRIDGGNWNGCTSPLTYTLANGTHTFEVYATDNAGNEDATPASRSWTISAGSGCTGNVTVNPGENIVTKIEAMSAGQKACINEGVYNITNDIDLDVNGVTLEGVYTTNRPRIVGPTGTSCLESNIIDMSGRTNVTMKNLRIAGATHPGGICAPDGARGIKSQNAKEVIFENMYLEDNDNAGIGGGDAEGMDIRNSYFVLNGCHPHYQGGSTSAAGVKTTAAGELRNSTFTENCFNGYWKDNPNPGCGKPGAPVCAPSDRLPGPVYVTGNTLNDNGKFGFDYEITNSPAIDSYVAHNDMQGNGWNHEGIGGPVPASRRSDMLIGTSEDIQVTDNDFGVTAAHPDVTPAIIIYDDGRAIDDPAVLDVDESLIYLWNNRFNGDTPCDLLGTINDAAINCTRANPPAGLVTPPSAEAEG